ncbi:hypothetical protein PJL18_04203 [Paenarthrobacter nicotinovorans]|nr:hypothetical protein [Paenarthrobacter nicotinovorans]
MGTVLQPVLQPKGANNGFQPPGVGRCTCQGERKRDVLLGRQRGHQVEGLENETDPLAAKRRELPVIESGELCSAQDDPAGIGCIEPRQAVHKR